MSQKLTATQKVPPPTHASFAASAATWGDAERSLLGAECADRGQCDRLTPFGHGQSRSRAALRSSREHESGSQPARRDAPARRHKRDQRRALAAWSRGAPALRAKLVRAPRRRDTRAAGRAGPHNRSGLTGSRTHCSHPGVMTASQCEPRPDRRRAPDRIRVNPIARQLDVGTLEASPKTSYEQLRGVDRCRDQCDRSGHARRTTRTGESAADRIGSARCRSPSDVIRARGPLRTPCSVGQRAPARARLADLPAMRRM